MVGEGKEGNLEPDKEVVLLFGRVSWVEDCNNVQVNLCVGVEEKKWG